MSKRVPMTASGKIKLVEELTRLKAVERPKVVKEIEEARGHGDLSENAEYHAAKEKQGHIETRIRMLEDVVGRAEVVDLSKIDGSKVVFGVTVRLYDTDAEKELRYKIVGELEADISKGLISISSPIAKALIGKEAGDEVTVQTPGGSRELEIIEICLE
ncbi:MAG TPA: transcription elongation factor GreA [Bdellovibrionota bacterium]|nr:transcription elongation factor GreA [Bdellovibrionota bacterium]